MHTEYFIFIYFRLGKKILSISKYMHVSKFTFIANKDDVIFTSEIISVIPLAMEVRNLL